MARNGIGEWDLSWPHLGRRQSGCEERKPTLPFLPVPPTTTAAKTKEVAERTTLAGQAEMTVPVKRVGSTGRMAALP